MRWRKRLAGAAGAAAFARSARETVIFETRRGRRSAMVTCAAAARNFARAGRCLAGGAGRRRAACGGVGADGFRGATIDTIFNAPAQGAQTGITSYRSAFGYSTLAVPCRHGLQVLVRVSPPSPKGRRCFERLCSGAVWSGAGVDARDALELLWSDIPNDRMLLAGRARLTVWRETGGVHQRPRARRRGALLHCSHGQRAVIRTRFDAAGAAGRRRWWSTATRGPAPEIRPTIVVKRDGSIWFTDPPYGIVSDHEGHKADSELGDCYVFR